MTMPFEAARCRTLPGVPTPLRTDHFGHALEQARGRRSLQTVTARLARVGLRTDKTQLSKYENGKVERPDLLLVWVLTRLYGAVLDPIAESLFLDRARPPAGSAVDALTAVRSWLRNPGQPREPHSTVPSNALQASLEHPLTDASDLDHPAVRVAGAEATSMGEDDYVMVKAASQMLGGHPQRLEQWRAAALRLAGRMAEDSGLQATSTGTDPP